MTESGRNLIQRALTFASEAHAGQIDKLGVPYIFHPVSVARKVAMEHRGDHVIAAALLHDVLEDTDTDEEMLAVHFGRPIARIVRVVSNLDKLPYPEFIQSIIDSRDIDAHYLKVCDINDNLEDDRLFRLPQKDIQRLVAKYVPAKTDLIDSLGALEEAEFNTGVEAIEAGMSVGEFVQGLIDGGGTNIA